MSKQQSSPTGCLAYLLLTLLTMVLGFTGYWVIVLKPQGQRTQQMITDFENQEQADAEKRKAFWLNEDNVNIEACKNLIDENIKPCADFADKCYRLEKLAEQMPSSGDPGIDSCKSKGWTFENEKL